MNIGGIVGYEIGGKVHCLGCAERVPVEWPCGHETAQLRGGSPYHVCGRVFDGILCRVRAVDGRTVCPIHATDMQDGEACSVCGVVYDRPRVCWYPLGDIAQPCPADLRASLVYALERHPRTPSRHGRLKWQHLTDWLARVNARRRQIKRNPYAR